MPSPQLHVMNALLRVFVRRKLRRALTPFDVRRVFDGLAPSAPRKVRFRLDSLGGVPGEWAEAEGTSRPVGALCYFHGGGYVAMSPKTHRAITGGFARKGFRVFAPAYRLAPEHPFPAALDDAEAAYLAFVANVEGPIFIAGNSAGGGLAAALMLRLRDRHEPLPTAACLFSPLTDLTFSGASILENQQSDVMLGQTDPGRMPTLAKAYAGNEDPSNPSISPLFGSWRGLPPTILFVGDGEMLRDDSVRLSERARADGVKVDLQMWRKAPHAWPVLQRTLPEARQALRIAARFLLDAATKNASAPGPGIATGASPGISSPVL